MPKTPIYTAMLSEERARRDGAAPPVRPRRRCGCSRQEGFSGGDYVDIFDGGPTMSADDRRYPDRSGRPAR